MNKIERVTAVLEGRPPDRPPVSFWYHFGSERVAGPAAVEAHVRHLETYDLDLLKIMDDNGYPRSGLPAGIVERAEDLDQLPVWRGDEEGFGKQLELIGELARRYGGQVRMATTIFNAWTMLRKLTVPATGEHRPPTYRTAGDHRDATLSRLLQEVPAAFERALSVISESLSNYARQCLAAGADGVFLSVRDDNVDTSENGAGTYDRFVRPGDLVILRAAGQAPLNLLHACGRPLDFDRFADYPVHAISWADRTVGPSIAAVAGSMRPAICAGLDHIETMTTGSPDDCARQVADAVEQAGAHPMIVAPGCTYDPRAVPVENLHAIRRAVETG